MNKYMYEGDKILILNNNICKKNRREASHTAEHI